MHRSAHVAAAAVVSCVLFGLDENTTIENNDVGRPATQRDVEMGYLQQRNTHRFRYTQNAVVAVCVNVPRVCFINHAKVFARGRLSMRVL